MNDTHPTVAVAELMRILLDEEEVWNGTMHGRLQQRPVLTQTIRSWQKRWRNGRSTCSPDCFRRVYQIIQEIDRRFVIQVREMYPGNEEKVAKMADFIETDR